MPESTTNADRKVYITDRINLPEQGGNLEIRVAVEKVTGTWIEYDDKTRQETGLRGLLWKEDRIEYVPNGHRTYYTYYKIREDGTVEVEHHIHRYNMETGLTYDETLIPKIRPEHIGVHYVAVKMPQPIEDNPDFHAMLIGKISITKIQEPPSTTSSQST